MMDRPALLTRVLTDYLAFQQASRSDTLPLFAQVLEAWNHAASEIAEQNRSRGISFNPFTLIKIGETSHSRILGDLLNPRGSHGQGDLLLKVFLEKLGYTEPESDGWQVTVETGRVDILIWRSHPEKGAIIIENKSNNAGDQINQIYRYWHREMYLWDRELWNATDDLTTKKRSQRFHIVYLPADGGRSPAEHCMKRPEDWTDADNPHPDVPLDCKTMSLLELTELWLDKAVSNVPVTNTRLRDFLSQYQELWKS
jgi:hypothetical protein